MSFGIEFLPDARFYEEDRSVPFRRGRISIGDFEEQFVAPVDFWKERDYEDQWRDAIDRILVGSGSSCLVTAISEPKEGYAARWWELFRIGDDVAFHEVIVPSKVLGETFDPSNPYAHVGEYTGALDDGEPISEWRIDLSALTEFLERP